MMGIINLVLITGILQGLDAALVHKVGDDRGSWLVKTPMGKPPLQSFYAPEERARDLKVVCGISNNSSSKIVGGVEARVHEFPWQAAINSTDRDFCGGSLISEQWVMTAASCVNGISSFDILLGAHDLKVEEPDRITMTATEAYVHPDWNAVNLQGNIALIRLPVPVALNSYISPVCLPDSAHPDVVGSTVIVSGWGRFSDFDPSLSSVLLKAEPTVVSQTSCRDYYGNVINGGVLCSSVTDGSGICKGDIGGPLTYVESDGRFVQLGVLSLYPSLGCESGNPDVSTRVSFYVDWISNITGLVFN